MNDNLDVLIVGGGMVGASLALALADSGYRIGVVEAVPFNAEEQPSFDARIIALSEGSRRIFGALGLWARIRDIGTTPIEHIHVSERGGFGVTRLHAEAEGVAALGQVVESRVLGQALGNALLAEERIELICPATVSAVDVGGDGATVVVDTGDSRRALYSRLVVAADGGRSTVRELLGSRTFGVGYGQTAVISTVYTDRPHTNTAFERFTDSGPLALLPCTGATEDPGRDRRWSLVWTVRDAQVDELLGWDEETFLARLQARFGYRAGRFRRPGARHAYPLALQYVRDHVRPRLAFIGNAAHTIHPVAGQGFNLGLRDVAVLAEVLSDAAARGEDPGAESTLAAYAAWRRPDYLRVLGFTDALVRGFSNRVGPLRLGRNLGLFALDALPQAKHLLARQAMGLTGRQPRLARGLPLREPR